mgnify:CR=1 FL=1
MLSASICRQRETTTFHDEIYGDITVPNEELDDMILIKSDGYPTYNLRTLLMIIDEYYTRCPRK